MSARSPKPRQTPPPGTRPTLRCAIYTRVSTEDGLDQEFNSLDDQREAAEAYVRSQAHEGWRLLPGRYDDGGFSGGSLERPALQRLLAEVRARRVDVIVVYKVDRLTRALSDFAKYGRAVRRTRRLVRVGDPGVQHHHQHGAAHAERAAVVRPVRARGHRRAHPRQDRREQAQGDLDGRGRAARLPGRGPSAARRRGARRPRPGDLRGLPRPRHGGGAEAGPRRAGYHPASSPRRGRARDRWRSFLTRASVQAAGQSPLRRSAPAQGAGP